MPKYLITATSAALLLAFGTATAQAQDLTDMAKDKAVDMAKDKAADAVMGSDAAQDVAKDVAMEKAQSAILGGEARSTTDIVKDKAMDMAEDKALKMNHVDLLWEQPAREVKVNNNGKILLQFINRQLSHARFDSKINVETTVLR